MTGGHGVVAAAVTVASVDSTAARASGVSGAAGTLDAPVAAFSGGILAKVEFSGCGDGGYGYAMPLIGSAACNAAAALCSLGPALQARREGRQDN